MTILGRPPDRARGGHDPQIRRNGQTVHGRLLLAMTSGVFHSCRQSSSVIRCVGSSIGSSLAAWPHLGRCSPSAGVRVDEISQGPKRDFRLPGRWLVAAAAVGLVAVTMALILTRGGSGHHAIASPSRSAVPSVSGPSPTAAPGTVLVGCAAAVPGQLPPDWRAWSLQAGPLWFVDELQSGYLHSGGPHGLRVIARHGIPHLIVMVVEVEPGSVVVMKPAASSRPYFRFVNGFHQGGGNELPTGDSGFTLVSCPPGHPGPNGQVTYFDLGFWIQTGHAAAVDIWPSASSRPIQVTFTCPSSSCAG